jgi:hypothetical protein
LELLLQLPFEEVLRPVAVKEPERVGFEEHFVVAEEVAVEILLSVFSCQYVTTNRSVRI